MDDEMRSTGMSALESYTLGRLSARNQQVLGDAAEAFGRRLFRPADPAVDVNALIAENAALRQQLADIQANLSNLESDYSRLRAWGTRASKILSEHGLIKD